MSRSAQAVRIRVLGEEPVAGIDGVRADGLRRVGDELGVEVAADGMLGLPDLVRLVGLHAVGGLAVSGV